MTEYNICMFCEYEHAEVEARGLWYCPNPICPGCAGGQQRHVRNCKQCATVDEGDGIKVIKGCREFDELISDWNEFKKQNKSHD